MAQIQDFKLQTQSPISAEEFLNFRSETTAHNSSIPDPTCLEHEGIPYLVKTKSMVYYYDMNGSGQIDDGDLKFEVEKADSIYLNDPKMIGSEGLCPGAISNKSLTRVAIRFSIVGDESSRSQELIQTRGLDEGKEAKPVPFELRVADFNNDGKVDYGFLFGKSLSVFIQS